MAEGKSFKETRDTAINLLTALGNQLGVGGIESAMHDRLVDQIQLALVKQRTIGANQVMESVKSVIGDVERILNGGQ